MLTLRGQVMNVLRVDARTSKEGEKFEGYDQVQIMCQEATQNGETRFTLQTMKTERPEQFRRLVGKVVSCAVGVFAVGGQVRFFLPKGDASSSAVAEEVSA